MEVPTVALAVASPTQVAQKSYRVGWVCHTTQALRLSKGDPSLALPSSVEQLQEMGLENLQRVCTENGLDASGNTQTLSTVCHLTVW